MLLDGKQEGEVLGETTDLDFFKQKLQREVDRGIPLDHPSLDKLHKQIALLEDASKIRERQTFYVDVGNMPADKLRQSMEELNNQIKQKGQLNG